MCGRQVFFRNQAFATQEDEVNRKCRMVRRVIKTIQEVKIMLDKMASPPVDIYELTNILPDGTIPHHFFCCISQDIMSDPVKTIDGHTYDRPSIERWFLDHSTSPLTGLSLASKALVTNVILRDQIDAFVKQHTPSSASAQVEVPPTEQERSDREDIQVVSASQS